MQSSSPSVVKQGETLRSKSIGVGGRLISWGLIVAIGPLLVLLLLLRPGLDIVWSVPSFHTVIVSMAATLGVVLALLMLWVADEQRDGRILLICFAFLMIAGMFFIHAIATPNVLMVGRHMATSWSTTLGLSIAGVLFAFSGFNLSERINSLLTRNVRGWLALLLLLMLGYALLTLIMLPSSEADAGLRDDFSASLTPLHSGVIIIGLLCYVVALTGYARRSRRRFSAENLSLLGGITLLAEALFIRFFSHAYSLSFWLYHVYEIIGLLAISWSVLRRYRIGVGASLPENLFLPSTLTRIQEGYAQAITELLYSLSRGMAPSQAQRDDLRQRFSLGEGQLLMLEHAASAVAVERQRRQQIEQLNARLRQVERDRELLTQMIIHDLKNPISAIGGTLNVLNYVTLDDEVAELVANARGSVRTLQGLVGDLLDMGRLQEGRLELQKTTFSASSLLASCADELRGWASGNRKSIRVEVPEAVMITGDRRLLQRVVLNLVSNAIKHTPPETEVVLRARPASIEDGASNAEESGVIEVADSGPGMSAEVVATVFERYASSSSDESAGQRNTGLGLAFCKLAVEAHHGTIAVFSAPGLGTVVRITLPPESDKVMG